MIAKIFLEAIAQESRFGKNDGWYYEIIFER